MGHGTWNPTSLFLSCHKGWWDKIVRPKALGKTLEISRKQAACYSTRKNFQESLQNFKTYLKNKITLLVPGGAGLRLWRFVCLRLGLFRFHLRKEVTLSFSQTYRLQGTDHVEKYYEHTFCRYENCFVTHFLFWIFAAVRNSGFRLYSFRHI